MDFTIYLKGVNLALNAILHGWGKGKLFLSYQIWSLRYELVDGDLGIELLYCWNHYFQIRKKGEYDVPHKYEHQTLPLSNHIFGNGNYIVSLSYL